MLLPPLGLHASLPLQYLLAAGVAAAVWILGSQGAVSKFGGKIPSGKEWKLALAAFALTFPINALVRLAVPGLDGWYANLTQLTSWAGFIAIFSWWIPLAVLLEEFACRGLVQERLMRITSPKFALPAAALFFTLIHFQLSQYTQDASFLAGTFGVLLIGALALTLLYAATRSLVATIAMHMLYNLVSGLQTLLHVAGPWEGEAALWAAWAIVLIAMRHSAGELVGIGIRAWKDSKAKLGWAQALVLLAVVAIPWLLLAV